LSKSFHNPHSEIHNVHGFQVNISFDTHKIIIKQFSRERKENGNFNPQIYLTWSINIP
jgi:hypothetical protein